MESLLGEKAPVQFICGSTPPHIKSPSNQQLHTQRKMHHVIQQCTMTGHNRTACEAKQTGKPQP